MKYFHKIQITNPDNTPGEILGETMDTDRIKAMSQAAAALGRIGGKTKGKSKVRGDSEYYRNIRKLRKNKIS
jgi:hypothetical protein